MDGDEHVVRVEAVYRSIHPMLWRALLAYTADRETASDAESEAFAQALRRGGEVADVASWVWRSAFTIAAGMLAAKAKVRPLVVASDGASEPAASAVEFASLLGGLSGQQRACMVLRYMGGMDTAAIAAALHTTATTVRVQLHRAHRSLRETLKEAEHG
jgi:RNA polymerase sigma-70 factor (ECF subfamily)